MKIFDGINIDAEILDSKEMIQYAKIIDFEGYNLLDLKEPLSLETLKKSYKKAVMKYHPDVGGNHEDMQIVNRAYIEFKHMLDYFKPSDKDDGSDYFQTKSVHKFIFEIYLILLRIYSESWKLDSAFLIAKNIIKNNYSDLKFKNDNDYVFYDLITNLWKKLSMANKNYEVEYIKNFLIMKSPIYNTRPVPKRIDFDKYLTDKRRFKNLSPLSLYNFRTVGCLENAYLLNILDEREFKAFKNELLEIEEKKVTSENKKLEKFFSQRNFVNLPSDEGINHKLIPNELIHWPGYSSQSIYNLNKQQQAEYCIAFSENTTIYLIEKWLFPRYKSMLESIILFDSNLINSCLMECRFFLSLSFALGGHWIQKMVTILEYLKNLSKKDRIERIQLLKKIHNKYINGEYAKSIGLTELEIHNHQYTIGVSDYLDVISFPIKKLELIITRGNKYITRRT